MSSELLKGKTAIVTGGGTLFGTAVAKTHIADGAKVMIVEINSEIYFPDLLGQVLSILAWE